MFYRFSLWTKFRILIRPWIVHRYFNLLFADWYTFVRGTDYSLKIHLYKILDALATNEIASAMTRGREVDSEAVLSYFLQGMDVINNPERYNQLYDIMELMAAVADSIWREKHERPSMKADWTSLFVHIFDEIGRPAVGESIKIMDL